MKKFISSVLFGIGMGCTILVIILAVLAAVNEDVFNGITSQMFIKYAVCSVIIGIGFSVPAIVYKCGSISKVLQTIIHLGIGFAVYIPTAFVAGWISVEHGLIPVLISLSVSIAAALIIWQCFNIHYKKQAKIINEQISKKQKD